MVETTSASRPANPKRICTVSEPEVHGLADIPMYSRTPQQHKKRQEKFLPLFRCLKENYPDFRSDCLKEN